MQSSKAAPSPINDSKKVTISKNNKFQPTKSEIFSEFESFRLLITASSGSGKSQLVKTLLTDPSFGIRDKFTPENVFLLCPTQLIDDAWDDVKEDLKRRSNKEHDFNEQEQFFSKDLEQSLSTVYQQLVEKSMDNKSNKTAQVQSLIVLDDCLLEIDMSSNHSQLARMLVKMRHHKISIIVISQYLKSLHPIARAQFSHYITFSTSNQKEVAKIKDEVSSTLPSKQFLDLYNFCTDQRYGYMLVIFSFPVKFKFFKGVGSELHQLQI